MTIAAPDACCDAIAAYFAAMPASFSGARRGWPEFDQSFSVGDPNLPFVSVTALDEDRDECPPHPIYWSTNVDPALLDVTFRTHWLRVMAQIDLWASHRAKLDIAALALEEALHNRLPFRSGLLLTSTGYYGRPIAVTATQARQIEADDGVARGLWRRAWDIVASTDLVQTVTMTLKDATVLRLTSGTEAFPILEPDRTVE